MCYFGGNLEENMVLDLAGTVALGVVPTRRNLQGVGAHGSCATVGPWPRSMFLEEREQCYRA